MGQSGLDQGDQGSRQGGDRSSRNAVLPRQRKKSVKERNEAAESLAHTALMKKKLQEAGNTINKRPFYIFFAGAMLSSADYAGA